MLLCLILFFCLPHLAPFKSTQGMDDISLEAKATYKKNEGNLAFQEQNYAQAAVFYTEALVLSPNAICYRYLLSSIFLY